MRASSGWASQPSVIPSMGSTWLNQVLPWGSHASFFQSRNELRNGLEERTIRRVGRLTLSKPEARCCSGPVFTSLEKNNLDLGS